MSAGRRDVKVPAEHLLRYIADHPGCIEGWNRFHPSQARRLSEGRKTGWLSFFAVDDMCNLLQVHMSQVYGDIYWDISLPETPERRKELAQAIT